MKRILFMIVVAFPQMSLAAPADKLGSRRLTCGKKVITFNGDASKAAVGQQAAASIAWDSGRVSGMIGGKELQYEDGTWSFDEIECKRDDN